MREGFNSLALCQPNLTRHAVLTPRVHPLELLAGDLGELLQVAVRERSLHTEAMGLTGGHPLFRSDSTDTQTNTSGVTRVGATPEDPVALLPVSGRSCH